MSNNDSNAKDKKKLDASDLINKIDRIKEKENPIKKIIKLYQNIR